MRPDARLLVRADALPVVPVGATVWLNNDEWLVLRHSQYGVRICCTTFGKIGESATVDVSPTLFVDLSAPEQCDGYDVRLDALPWVLRVLHPNATNIENHALDQYPSVALVSCDSGVVVPWCDYCKSRGTWSGSRQIDPWPDLTNLSTADAARAVVCAALNARKAP